MTTHSTSPSPSNRSGHDSNAANAFDAALDALGRGHTAPHRRSSGAGIGPHPDSPPHRETSREPEAASNPNESRNADLIATAARLQSAQRASEPDPAFAASLRRALLSPPAPPLAAPPRPAPIPARLGGRIGVAHLPQSGPRRSGLFWPAAELATMVLIFAVFLGTITGGDSVLPRLVDLAGLRQDPPNDARLSSSTTLDAPNLSPVQPAATPDPAVFTRACVVPPADVNSLVATANADGSNPSDPAATGPTIPSDTGQPADQNVSEPILKTIATWIACSNSGATDRAASVLTPRMFAGWDSITSDSQSNSPPTRITLVVRTVGPVRILPDERAIVQLDIDAESVGEIRTITYTFSLFHDGDRWLIDEIAQSAPAQTTGTPGADLANTVTVPIHVNLRSSATFSAISYVEAAPGSILSIVGDARSIDGIVWQQVAGPDKDHPFFLPAAYLIAFGATIPNLPATDPDGLGVPDLSECQVTPIPLTDVAAYMGPAGPTTARSANTYLATVGDDTDADTRAAVVDSLREVFACHNAGSYTRSVALNTEAFYRRAGAGAYRPTGTEPDLATARPLSPDGRSEILAIGDAYWLDDGRVAVILLGQSHDGPTQVTATFYTLTLTGGHWLIDDAISIETSARPGAGPIESFTQLETEAVVDTQTSTPSIPATIEPGTPTSASTPDPAPDGTSCTIPPADVVSLAATANAINASASPTPASTPTPIPATVGHPADPLIADGVRATVYEWVACVNAGEGNRALGLFTPGTLARFLADPSGISWDPDLDPAPATPRPAAERTVIQNIERVRLLPDGRAVVDFTLASEDDPDGRALPIQYVLVERGDRWLIDDVAFGEEAVGTPSATPNTESVPSPPVAQPIFPVGATVNVRASTIVLRAVPRTVSEPIARLTPPREMTVFGPLTDSGDALWLPVTDNQSGVSGYVSFDLVLPPERFSQAGFPVGTTVMTTAPIHLRGAPETTTVAESVIPAGTFIDISGSTISAGLFWIRVYDPVNGGEKWIPFDLLLAATVASSPIPTFDFATPTPGIVMVTNDGEFTTGQVVTVSTDAVYLRSAPAFDDDNMIDLLAEGEEVRITGPTVFEDDAIWWPVEYGSDGSTGFIVAEFLEFDEAAMAVSDCAVIPRLDSDIEFAGLTSPTLATVTAIRTVVPELNQPTTSADEFTRAALTATLDELAACVAAGDPLRVYALYSDWLLDWLLTLPIDGMSRPGQPGVLVPGLLVRVQPDAAEFGITLGDAVILPDGRVRARVFVHAPGQPPEGFPTEYIFVHTDGRWLIDRVLDLGPLDQFQRQIAPGALPVAGSTVSVLTENVYLRADPSFAADPIAILPAGTKLVATGETVLVDGVSWWRVTDPATGQTGHIVAVYLQYEELFVGVDILDPARSPICAPAAFPTPGSGTVSGGAAVGGNGESGSAFGWACGDQDLPQLGNPADSPVPPPPPS